MNDKIEIVSSILSLVFLFFSVTRIRLFIRSRMKGYLVSGFGCFLFSLSLLSVFLTDWEFNVILVLLIISYLIYFAGVLIAGTYESGTWSELRSKNTYINILLGNVESVDRKDYKPSLRKSFGIFCSALLIILAPFVYLYFSAFMASFFLIFGIALFVLTMIYGRK